MSHALNVSSVALLKLLEFKYYQCRILPCLPLSGHYIGYTSQLWLIHQLNWLWLTCGAYYEHVNMKLAEFGLANLQKWTNLHLNISKLEKRHALKTNLWPVLPLKHLCYSLQNKACSPLKLGVLNSRQSETCFFPETNILSHTTFMIQLHNLFEIYQSWKIGRQFIQRNLYFALNWWLRKVPTRFFPHPNLILLEVVPMVHTELNRLYT